MIPDDDDVSVALAVSGTEGVSVDKEDIVAFEGNNHTPRYNPAQSLAHSPRPAHQPTHVEAQSNKIEAERRWVNY